MLDGFGISMLLSDLSYGDFLQSFNDGVEDALAKNETIHGVLIDVLGVGVLALLPFLDQNPAVRLRERPLAVLGGGLVVAGIIALTVWGLIS